MNLSIINQLYEKASKSVLDQQLAAVIIKSNKIISTPQCNLHCKSKGSIHAEVNAILKAAKTGNSVDGSTLYLTLSPCLDCSKLILQSGIKKVVYLTNYRNLEGVDFLKQFIEVEQYGE